MTDEQLAEIQARSDVGVWLTGAWAYHAGADRRRLLAEVRRQREALDRVRALAEVWQARGEHQRDFAATVPEDVRDALLDSAADWIQRAYFVREALGES